MTDNDDALNQLLAADADEEPRPGFDTRFHARLAELKATKHKRIWVFSIAGALAGAAAIAVAVVPRTPIELQRDPAALEVAMEYELLENYDIVKDLPVVEVLAQLEEQP